MTDPMETAEDVFESVPVVARGWAKAFHKWLGTSRATWAPERLDRNGMSLAVPFAEGVERRLCNVCGLEWSASMHYTPQPWMSSEEKREAEGYCLPHIF